MSSLTFYVCDLRECRATEIPMYYWRKCIQAQSQWTTDSFLESSESLPKRHKTSMSKDLAVIVKSQTADNTSIHYIYL